jgi:lauroyl/myristoyl acyltransferase
VILSAAIACFYDIAPFGRSDRFHRPARWLLWLGILFTLLVYFFPPGITGTLMKNGAHR